MDRERPYAVLVSQIVNCASWASHAGSLWIFSTSLRYTGRGPLVLNSCWYLTLVASILHFHSTIRWTMNPNTYQYTESSNMYFSLLSRVSVYVHMGLQVLYGISLIFPTGAPTRKRLTGSGHSRLWVRETAVSIQGGVSSGEEEDEEEEVREKQPLINSRRNGSIYGTVNSARDDMNLDFSQMNAYEDRANPLSLLLFWWVWPLLRRGAMGHLGTTEDLPPLPNSLQTSHIREKFKKVLLRRGVRFHTESTTTNLRSSHQQEKIGWSSGSGSGAAEFLDSEVAMRSIARITPLPSATPPITATDSGTDAGTGPSADGANHQATGSKDAGKGPRSSISLLYLFSAINRAFGWHYYPLGLLKFTTDLLGFAGPLLLYQLVSFIENKQVSSCIVALHLKKQCFPTWTPAGADVLWLSLCSGTSVQHTGHRYTHFSLQLSSMEWQAGELAQMVERSLSMREVPGSIPGFSIFLWTFY